MVASLPQVLFDSVQQDCRREWLREKHENNCDSGVKAMTHAAGEALKEDSPILHAAIALAPQIHAEREEIERGRRLPPKLAHAMKEAGIFGMTMPRAWGGPELDPPTQFRVLEALAMADGSVGWCAMIGCDGGYVSAFIDQDVARTMWSDMSVATAAAATPTGRAQRVSGGYRVNGRFPFVSGHTNPPPSAHIRQRARKPRFRLECVG
jgi:alkylation response protein AidB-like acyl-CoA dehydrogenase